MLLSDPILLTPIRLLKKLCESGLQSCTNDTVLSCAPDLSHIKVGGVLGKSFTWERHAVHHCSFDYYPGGSGSELLSSTITWNIVGDSQVASSGNGSHALSLVPVGWAQDDVANHSTHLWDIYRYDESESKGAMKPWTNGAPYDLCT